MTRDSVIRAMVLGLAASMLSEFAASQAAPAGTTGSTALWDYSLGVVQSTQIYSPSHDVTQLVAINGEAMFMNGKQRAPFQLTYSGGYILPFSGTGTGSGLFQHFLISQAVLLRRTTVKFSDEVLYYPLSPTTGFSGVPGAGSLPGIPGLPPTTIIFTDSRFLTNLCRATATRPLTGKWTLGAGGNYEITRFLGETGIDVNSYGLESQLTRRVNTRNSVWVQYSFSDYSYQGLTFSLSTQTIQPGFSRSWNRWLTTWVAAGPEWTHSNDSTILPSSLGIAVDVTAAYTRRSVMYQLSFKRAVTAVSGLGTPLGATNNAVTADASRGIGRGMRASISAWYTKVDIVGQSGTADEVLGAGSLTKQIGESLRVGVHYTIMHQISSFSLPPGALNGFVQTVGFSASFHQRPRSVLHP